MKRKPRKALRETGFEEWVGNLNDLFGVGFAIGGYMTLKKKKLEDQFASDVELCGKVDDLFKGVSIFVNGFTIPSADELRNLMIKHGGVYHHYYSTTETNYVIASNLPDTKVKQLNGLKVVKPEWIVDSIKAGKRLDYTDYLLYTNRSVRQQALEFKSKQLDKNLTMPTKSSDIQEKPSKNQYTARTASDERFLSEFYNNSRLHLISTMGAMFKQYINELRSNEKHEFPGKALLNTSIKATPSTSARNYAYNRQNEVIMHIDMDCFFVSVGLKKYPTYRGLPVAVTHAKGNKSNVQEGSNRKYESVIYQQKLAEKYKDSNSSDFRSRLSDINDTDSMSEIASCSYEARKAGIKNGMFLGQALKLCPGLKTIPYDFEGYKEVSLILYNTIARYTLDIEAVSCDEMFVDCSEILGELPIGPMEFASHIRQEIKEKTGCPCSTGFGSNRLQARLATKKAKPDGQFYLKPEEVKEYMSDVKVSDLPGVGRSISYKLRSMGIMTCGDLQTIPLAKLQSEFGKKFGETLLKNSQGIDDRGLTFTNIRKSVSAEVNYGIRFQNSDERDKFLQQMCTEVSGRLAELNMKGRCVTLKLMVRAKNAPEESAKFMGHGICDSITKSSSLSGSISEPSCIMREVLSIFRHLNIDSKELRGIGIQISRLEKNNKTNNTLNKFFNVKGSTKDKITDNKIKTNNKTIEPIPGPSNAVPKRPLQSFHISEASNISISQVDPSFLEALPEDLKKEVLDSVLKHNEKTKSNSTLRSDHPSLNENSTQSASREEPEFSCLVGFLELSQIADMSVCKADAVFVCQCRYHILDTKLKEDDVVAPVEMKKMIQEWVKTVEEPQKCDILMLSDYLKKLVISRHIDDLPALIKTFYRNILRERKNISWQNAYSVILENVQTTMKNAYGGQLLIIDKF